MDDFQVKCFFAVARANSFSEASRTVFVSRATLSRTISSMENDLGFKLFYRNGSSIQLTPSGQLMLHALEESQSIVNRAKTEADRLSKGITGKISLGILDGQLMPPTMRSAIKRFEEGSAEVEICLESASYVALTEGLYKGKFDAILTFRFDVCNEDWVEMREIERLQTFFVMSIDHPKAQCDNLHITDFKDDTFVVAACSSEDRLTEDYGKAFRNFGFKPKVIVAPDIETQMLWLELGRGISRANKYHTMCSNPILHSAVIPELPQGQLVLAWKATNENAFARSFINLLTA